MPEDPGRGCADFVRYKLVTDARTVGNGQCGEASAAFTTLVDDLGEHTAM